MIVSIYIGSDKLELFEDENISVTSSVLDIQDISKNTTDYSNAFTVPASDVNNKIFKHYYNANVDNTFDARVTVDGRIEIGGFPFRVGKILLQKVIVKSGVASSYTINFWGNLVSIKDLIGDDKLADLDLSAYDHEYTSYNVAAYLTLPYDYMSIIYTLLAKKQYYYNTDLSDSTMTDSLANIHYRPGGDNGVMWDDLSASLALYRIIEAIETDYGITFSTDFFGLDKFKNLYLWLNNSVDSSPIGEPGLVDFNAGDNTNFNLATDIGTFVIDVSKEVYILDLTVTPDSGFETVEYIVDFYSNADELYGSKTFTGTRNVVAILKDGGTYETYYKIRAGADFEYTCSCKQTRYINGGLTNTYITTGLGSVSNDFIIANNIPDLKIIDFLKGIFQAFKLVVIPQNDGTIYVDTVENYYASGQTIDLTEYIDAENVEVSRGEILNTIKYNFQPPQTILNQKFLETNGIAYGDEDAEIRDDNGKLLDGETLEVELPFEQVVYERLYDTNERSIINLMYGAIIDKNLEPVNIKPHVFYRQTKRVNGPGIGFIHDNGTKVSIRGNLNYASHNINDDDPTDSFIFSEEFDEFTGQLLTNNLYSNYHQSYINSLFNVKKRSYRFTVKKLPIQILLDLSLNDVVKIGYNYYRIDKFTVNLVTSATELNLVNVFL